MDKEEYQPESLVEVALALMEDRGFHRIKHLTRWICPKIANMPSTYDSDIFDTPDALQNLFYEDDTLKGVVDPRQSSDLPIVEE